MKQTNREKARDLLADGRWHSIEELDSVAGMQSARTRMSELVREFGATHKPLPDGSARYERRFRTRHAGTDREYSATDWRDRSCDDAMLDDFRWQASVARECEGRVARFRAGTWSTTILLSHLRDITDGDAAAIVFARYIDPWGA